MGAASARCAARGLDPGFSPLRSRPRPQAEPVEVAWMFDCHRRCPGANPAPRGNSSGARLGTGKEHLRSAFATMLDESNLPEDYGGPLRS